MAVVTRPEGTLPQKLLHWARTQPEAIAFRQKDYGIWQPYTWAEYARLARHFGLGLTSLGLPHGGHVAVISENRKEWVIAQLGLGMVGGVTVGVYPTSPAPEVEYLLAASDAVIAVCEDQEQVDKVLESRERLPRLERIVVIDPKGLRRYDLSTIHAFDDVLARGAAYEREHPALVDERLARQSVHDVALMIFTSGSTGRPKAAMLSYDNLNAATEGGVAVYGFSREDTVLSYLPLCHVAEQSFSVFIPMAVGCAVNFAESLRTVQGDLREIAPSIFLGVPRIWEKLHAGIRVKMAEARPAQQALFRWALDGCAPLAMKPRAQWSAAERARFAVADALIFRALKNAIGLTRCRVAFTGAAPISPEVIRFFRTLGVPLLEIYGMTETAGGVLGQTHADPIAGTVGVPMQGTEIRLAEDGEVLARGEAIFAGYYRNEEATKAAIVDGWLHTGDVGEMVEGQFRIVDRKKDIMITAGGKNLSPTEIEHAVKISPFVKEAIVFGDRRKFVSALLQIDLDTVGQWAEARGIAFTNYRSLSQHPAVRELVEAEVENANARLASVAQIKRFEILDKELDHDDGEVTATMKVRRKAIEQKYAEAIARLYA